MKTIKINVSSASYDIKLGKNILINLPKLLEDIKILGKLVIICDTNIEKLHLGTLCDILNNSSYTYETVVIKAGEEYKTLNTVSYIYEKLCELNITRKDTIIAFGGGVVGDISGFVSATYLRGINYIQIPTTLLSQVDSSIGGKTGVDLPFGKNLVGAFKQPKLVVADVSLLETLDEIQIASGMAEIIKAGFIRDKKLVEKLKVSEDFNKDIESFIESAINVKKEVVEIDEFEKYERMLLNFGHTLGHAIEKYHNFKGVTHGQAIAFGMCLVTKNEVVLKELKNILLKYNLKTECDIEKKILIELCKNDKKATKDSINLVIVDNIGEGKIENMHFEKMGEIYG